MKKYLIIFTILFNTTLFAEVVKKLNISGNDRISVETIKVYGDIKLNNDYSSQDINKILKNLYDTKFFEDVSVSLENGTLRVNVKEYKVINTLVIEGEKTKKIKVAIIERLALQAKSSFIKNELNEDLNLIKNIYSSLGYNFTKVEAKVEEFSKNRINLIFTVDRGEKTRISKINFIGDKKIKDRRLRDVIVSEEHKFWKFLTKNSSLNKNTTDLDKRLLTNYFKSIGYYDVSVLSSSAQISQDGYTSLTFNINAGTRYRIKKIYANVDPVFDKKIFIPLSKEFNSRVGKYYSPFIVKKLLDEVDIIISDNDLQFVTHSVNEIISGEDIEIKINIFEGSKQTVERIEIKGNTVTNEAVIRSELLLDEGDPFNNLKLDKSIARLKSRNLFGKVEKKITDGSSTDLKQIAIIVEEKPTGEISAGAGIGTNGGSLAFSVKENNWMGKGVQLSTFLDLSADSVKGALEVTNPNYNFTGNQLSYFVSSSANDIKESGYKNTITTTGVGTKFEQYKNIYIAPNIRVTYDDLTVLSTASDSLKKQAGAFTDLTFDYAISSDLRDRSFKPTDGYISTFAQALPIYADSPFIKNTYAFSKYSTLTPNIVGAFKIYGSAINGLDDKDVRISKRLTIPSNRLRGFEKGKVGPKDGTDYVGGNYVSAVNFEANLPNLLPESTNTEVGFFLDMGNIWGVDYNSVIDDKNKIRSSTGANISWLSPLGPMTFVIAHDITKASTDVPQSFKFRLGTTF
ncbi:outer membrane protein assembly factor BamA [Pelagibacteraceae bacterium]|nr:outer membrane protein assembly factor BamA [Pelagibacteraceae bacterium]